MREEKKWSPKEKKNFLSVAKTLFINPINVKKNI